MIENRTERELSKVNAGEVKDATETDGELKRTGKGGSVIEETENIREIMIENVKGGEKILVQ